MGTINRNTTRAHIVLEDIWVLTRWGRENLLDTRDIQQIPKRPHFGSRHKQLRGCPKLKGLTTASLGEDVEQLVLLCCWWECKVFQALRQRFGFFPKKNKVKYAFTLWSRNFTNIYLKKIKTSPYKKLYQMRIGALLIIAKNWKQLKCLSMDDDKNVWLSHTMESTQG